MALSLVAGAVVFLEPLVGLVLLLFGLALMQRRRDPGVVLVIAVGAFWLLMGGWTGLLNLLVGSTSFARLSLLHVLSDIIVVGGRLLVWGAAGYALWRYWQAPSATGGSG